MAGRQLVRWRVPKRSQTRPGTTRVRGRRAAVVLRTVGERQAERVGTNVLLRRPIGRRVELRRLLGGRSAARSRRGNLAGRHAVYRLLGERQTTRPRPGGVAGRSREYEKTRSLSHRQQIVSEKLLSRCHQIGRSERDLSSKPWNTILF